MISTVEEKLNGHIWTVILVYIVCGLGWIYCSDLIVQALFSPRQVASIQTFKGACFVFFTAGILFIILKRKNNSIRDLFLKLRHNMHNFKDTFEQTAVGMAHVSVEGEWIRVNGKLCDILGYSRSELLNMQVTSLTHPGDLEDSLKKDQQIVGLFYCD